MTQTDPTLTRNILEMVTIAGEFCNFIENASSHKREDFLRSMKSLAPLLYLRGTLIPDIKPEFPESNERYVTEEQWEKLFMSLRELLSDQDEFYYVDRSDTGEKAPLKGSLSEHFADVYQDMKDVVLLFKKPSLAARQNAIHECRQLFDEHWGERLATILPVLHALNQQTDIPSNEQDDFLGF